MKQVIGVVIILALCLALAYLNSKQAATKEDVEKLENELTDFREEVKKQFVEVNHNLDSLKSDTDTLKKGQSVIFNEVRKTNTSKSFWDLISGK